VSFKYITNLALIHNTKVLKALKSKCVRAKISRLTLKVKLLERLIKGYSKCSKRLMALFYLSPT
jgi:hypothetical protein